MSNKKRYRLSDQQFQKIVNINRSGSDPVMYLGGGIPMGSSLQEKINEYWDYLGRVMGFDPKTVDPINDREFYAKPVKPQKKKPTSDWHDVGRNNKNT